MDMENEDKRWIKDNLSNLEGGGFIYWDEKIRGRIGKKMEVWNIY